MASNVGGRISFRKIEDVMPILAVEDDLIVSKNAEVTIGYRLELPEIYSLSAEQLDQLHSDWVKALSVLRPGTVVHKQDWYYDAAYEINIDDTEEMRMSDRASERHFNERPILQHVCYLYVTFLSNTKRKPNSLGSSLNRFSFAPKRITNPGAVEQFVSVVGQMERILADSGQIKLHRLTTDEIVGTSTDAGVLEKYLSLNPQEEPILRDIDFRNGIQIGDNRCKLFTVSNADCLPAAISPGVIVSGVSNDTSKLFMSMGNAFGVYCNAPHIYNQYILIENEKEVIASLESRQRRMESLAPYSRPNGIYAEQVNAFLNETASAQAVIVQAHANLLVFGETDEELKRSTGVVQSCFSKVNVIPKEERFSMATIWWAGIPGNAGDLPREEYFTTFAGQASCLFNLETNYRSSASPYGIRLVDRLTGYPVAVDISDEPITKGLTTNRNKFILGPSGSGKSFIVNHLLHNYYKQGSHVVLVDVGGSYYGTCKYVGGLYFEYTESDPISFNPFLIGEGDTLDTEKKESLKTLLVTIWKSQDKSVEQAEYVALSTAISMYYEHLDACPHIDPSFDSFYEFMRGDYRAYLEEKNVREREFDMTNFLYVLSPFYRGGEFDYLLNSNSKADLLQEPFIVFELDNIKDHPVLFPVVTIVIMDVFISKMRKLKGKRKIICIEEAWKAIAKEGMADFIKYLFKTVRKFYGEAWVVTQEVDDILNSPVVKESIVANSDCKILMDQRKFAARFDDIAGLLGLTEKDVAQVMSVNSNLDPRRKYKECFIALGGAYSNVYGVEVPLEEYLIYTTEKLEKEAVEDMAERMGSYEAGIVALANQWRA
ncbi:TraG family conjugative transposon ATPase [Lewinella sp. IMCC34191]|uniref:TraG family conjugative transposon ATPase n=1 Tax=Lewinella sp. IMCC34191 TaxID=2259172 RepID=UPI000E27641D|nr:TraG family conjugative transposon ATPase [Lewinella sp. IMCC34191]